MWKRLLTNLGALAETRGRGLVISLFVLAILSALAIPGLKVSSSYRDLMPADRPEQREYDAFLDEFGAANDLIVVLEGKPEDTRPVADALAEALRAKGSPIADVFYRIDPNAMLERAPLFASPEDLEKASSALAGQASLLEKVGRIAEFSGLLGLATDQMVDADSESAMLPEEAEKAVGFLAHFFGEWAARIEDPTRTGFQIPDSDSKELAKLREFLASGGYLGSHDGEMLFLFVKPDRTSDDPEYLESVESAVDEARNSLSIDSDKVTIGYTGLPAHILTDVRSLREDLFRASVPSGILVFLVLWVGLRSFRRTLIALIALGCGLAISLGLARFVFGELNRMSMSFLAIMFGIGIDFAIYLIRRTDEEIRSGRNRIEATRQALVTSGQGIVAGGLVTALAFSVTAVSEFRGTSQLGLTTAMSVVIVLAVTLLLLPPLLMMTRPPEKKIAGEPADKVLLPDAPALKKLLPVFAGVVALAIFGAAVARQVPVDYNGLSVMPGKADSTILQLRMGEESDFQMTSAVVRAPDIETMNERVARLRTLDSVARVVSISDLLPQQQEEKLQFLQSSGALAALQIPQLNPVPDFTAIAEEINTLEESLFDAQDMAFSAGKAGLTQELQRVLDALDAIRSGLKTASGREGTARFVAEISQLLDTLRVTVPKWGALGVVTETDLPSAFVSRFRSPEGNYAAYVYPNGSVWEVDVLDEFLTDVRKVDPGVTGFPVISESNVGLLTSGIFQSLLLTVGVVVVLLALDLRKPKLVLFALFPLLVGMGLLQTLFFLTKQQYNLASINGLPLLLGLGVVYGVHLVHRWSEHPDNSAFAAVKTSGRAITLAGITTMAGLASLTFCIHRGVASFGWLLLQGIICMLVAALVALPLCIDLFSRRRK